VPLAVGPTWRTYRALLPGGAPLADSASLVLETEATRFPRDDRRIGLALAQVAVTPDRWGPTWPGEGSLPLLLVAALAAWLPIRLGAQPLVAATLAGCALLAAEPALASTRALLLAAAVLAAAHALLGVIRSRPLGFRSGPLLVASAAVLGLAALIATAALTAALPAGLPALALRLVGTLVIVVGVLCYVGFGITWALRSRPLLPALPLFTPVVGMAALAVAGHALAWLPWGTDRTAWPLLAIFTVGNALAWSRGARPRLSRRHAPALAAAGLALLLATLPLLQIGYLTTVGGTIDAVSYVARAEQIRSTGLLVLPSGQPDPIGAMIAGQLAIGIRQGDVYVLGFFSSLFGVRPHILFSVLMAVWYAAAPLGVFVLALSALRLGWSVSGAAALLVAVHPLLHWAALDNFLSQVAGTGVWCFALAACAAALAGKRGSQPVISWRPVVLAGLMLAALSTFYHAYLVYLVPVVALTALGRVAGAARGGLRPALSTAAQTLAQGAALATAALLLVPAGWVLAERMARLLGGSVGRGPIAEHLLGNIRVFPHPAELVGLVNHAQAAYEMPLPQLPAPLASALLALCGATALYGALRARPQARWMFAALALVLTAALLHQRLWLDMGRGFAYGYYKVISLAAPPATLLTVAGAAALLRDALRLADPWRDALRLTALSLPAAIACVGLTFLVSTSALVGPGSLQVDRATLEVQGVAPLVPPDEPLLVIDGRHPGTSWLLYLLRRPAIYLREPNPGYPALAADASPRPPRYALVVATDEPRKTRPGEPWFDPATHEVLWRNERYALLRRTDEH
jgi:hypothetical protein